MSRSRLLAFTSDSHPMDHSALRSDCCRKRRIVLPRDLGLGDDDDEHRRERVAPSIGRRSFAAFVAASLTILLGWAFAVQAEDPILITEFMASNGSTLTDNYGDNSDWIELYNASGATVNLQGYGLTDDMSLPTKWRFPSTNLAPHRYLLVYASGFDKVAPGKPLHTNFKLSSNGGVIGLVKPDGATVAWQVNYGPQARDLSMGLVMAETTVTNVFPQGAGARLLVPTKSTSGWQNQTFDDSTWQASTTALGFDTNTVDTSFSSLITTDLLSLMYGATKRPGVYLRVPFVINSPNDFSDLQFLIRYNDGFLAYLNGVEVGRRNAQPSPSFSSTATAVHPRGLAVVPELISSAQLLPQLRAGTNVFAIQGFNKSSSDGDFLLIPELRARQLQADTGSYVLLASPTPGAANSDAVTDILPAVTFSKSGGSYAAPFNVTLQISGAPENTVIHYTLDRSIPTVASPTYAGPISITNSLQLRARAFAPGYHESPISGESYVILSAPVQSVTSTLPIVVLHTHGGGSIQQSPDTLGSMQIHETVYGRSSLTNAPSIVTRVALHLRGSSTLGNPKQNLAVQALDEDGLSQNISPLGMPASADFVLYGPDQFEPVLIHNPFMYQLSRDIGDYAVRTRFVEVYLNQSGGPLTAANYNGIYVLMEKIQRGAEQINIDKLLPSDLTVPNVTGGYMLKIDRLGPGENGLNAAGSTLVYNDPAESEILQRPEQVAYITKYFNDFYSALNSTSFADPVKGYAPYVDVDSWIDHFLLDVTAFNVDGLRLSCYFFKPRNGPITFGPVWDYDRTLGSTDGRDFNPRTWRSNIPDLGTDFFNYPWWGRLFADPNFFQRFIDRYQSLREANLSQLQVNGLIDQLVGQITEAVPRELVRWNGWNSPRSGVVSNDGYSYNFGNAGYPGEVAWLKFWLKERMNFMDTNFVDRPTLSLPGGNVAAGSTVTLFGPPGASIYYTTDGTDPRAPGGSLAAQAQLYSGPVSIVKNTRLVARCRDLNHKNLTGANNPPISSPWSGSRAETYFVTTPALVITEVMFHSPTMTNDGVFPAHQFDYIEFKNNGSTPLALQGFSLVPERANADGHIVISGPAFSFPNMTLAAGQYAVVVQNLAAFQSRYGSNSAVIGQFTGSFVNGGSKLTLLGPLQEPILVLSYKDGWDNQADGEGFSLVIKDETTSLDKWTKKSSWHSGSVYLGTPGTGEPNSKSVPKVYLNELIVMADSTHSAAIEIFNSNSKSADVSGWWVTDDVKHPFRWRIPAGSTIAGNGYLSFPLTSLGVGPEGGVVLSEAGGTLYFFSAESNGLPSGFVDRFDYEASEPGLSYGRYIPNAALLSSQVDDRAQTAPSMGAANKGPVVGPVVISEIQYRPVDLFLNGAWWDNVPDEYIELYNNSNDAVPLFDTSGSNIPWRLKTTDSKTFPVFSFPSSFTMSPKSYVLVVSFDPVANPAQLALFKSRYGVPADAIVLGPYRGTLINAGDDLKLQRPASRASGSTVPSGYITVDQVTFSPTAPWPEGANGTGLSMQRVSMSGYGGDPANWIAALPTPTAVSRVGAAPNITAQPTGATNIVGGSQSFTVSASGTGTLGYQWLFQGAPMGGATQSTLTLSSLSLAQAGDYSVVVYDQNGSVVSSVATLVLQQPATILIPPDARGIPYGGSGSFSVVAAGSGDLFYQWSKDGVPIPGATRSTLYFNGVDFTAAGNYTVTVRNSQRSVSSAPVPLTVQLKPTLLLQPQNTVGVQGGSASFSFTAMGTPPFAYRWRKGTAAVTPYVTSSVPVLPGITLTFNNLQATNEGSYNVQFWNPISSAIVSSTVTLKVLADSDQDGMPDDWETANGLLPNDPSDAGLDPDKDGMKNLDEYLAGTDPHDALSYLKVDQLGLGADGRAQLTFFARSNHSYSLQLKELPTAGDWMTFTNFTVRATNRVETALDPYAAGTHRIYRLVTPVQPRSQAGPLILSQPLSLSIPVSGSATFQALVGGLGVVSYQWQKNGVDIPNATEMSYSIPNVSAGDAGTYLLRATDQTGSTLSQPATLEIR